MASKNDARRLKKKAERARKRKEVATAKLDINRIKSYNTKLRSMEKSHTRGLLSDILAAIGQCDAGIYHMDRLFKFTDILAARKPPYHTDELNSSFENIGVEAVQSFNEIVEVRAQLKEFASCLENPLASMEKMMSSMEYLLKAMPMVDKFAKVCGEYAKQVASLITESDALRVKYMEEHTEETDVTTPPLVSTEERDILRFYTALANDEPSMEEMMASIVDKADMSEDDISEVDDHVLQKENMVDTKDVYEYAFSESE